MTRLMVTAMSMGTGSNIGVAKKRTTGGRRMFTPAMIIAILIVTIQSFLDLSSEDKTARGILAADTMIFTHLDITMSTIMLIRWRRNTRRMQWDVRLRLNVGFGSLQGNCHLNEFRKS